MMKIRNNNKFQHQQSPQDQAKNKAVLAKLNHHNYSIVLSIIWDCTWPLYHGGVTRYENRKIIKTSINGY